MFEDITKEKKEMIKSALGLNLTTKLDVNEIAKKIVEKHKYNTKVKLEFKVKKSIFGKTIKMIMTHKGKVSEYDMGFNDTLKFTHYFNVD